jgi:glycosyltransferase involved in cell wall biosynthesis
MLKSSPSVLVICPTIGQASPESLNDSINSVLRQKYPRYCICIVDDSGIEDCRYSIASSQIEIFYLKNATNIGQASSINLAITTFPDFDYYCLIDDDDVWIDECKLRQQVDLLEANKNKYFCSTLSYVKLDNKEWQYEPNKSVEYSKSINDNPRSIFVFNPIVHSSVMIKKNIFREGLFYDSALKRAQDIDLWYRILCGYKDSYILLESPLVKVNMGNKKYLKAKLRTHYLDSVALSKIRSKYGLYRDYIDSPTMIFLTKFYVYILKGVKTLFFKTKSTAM